ncbi:MAG: methylated-DNA--[protein]-cysteine S-methyltransferase [Nitrospirae bacterium]|nr:methylated-DNA--[protein]-cysteine S-methyltransferase [Nitrospirota bacterium]
MKQSRSDLSEYYDILRSSIGTLYLIFCSSSLTGISFEKPSGIISRQTKHSIAAKKELGEYFLDGRMEFSIKTSFAEGTEFEKEVWAVLADIPYGETRTYKWIADKMGKPHASRAVGNALAKNPIPLIYPCHRIIESDGSIGGYTPGIDIKRRLLEIEYYTKLSKA